MRVKILFLWLIAINVHAVDEARLQEHVGNIMQRQISELENHSGNMNKTQLELLGQSINEARLFVAVSFSMPEKLIIDYIRQANKHGAYVVFQGFKDNDMASMMRQLSYWDEKLDISRVLIDPNVFESFDVINVPSIILSQDSYPCNTELCAGKHYDKLGGAVGIEYALKQFASKGDLRGEAQSWINR